MKYSKVIAGIAAICACVAASSLSAATIPAGTSKTIKTTSQISERDPVGRTFTGQVEQDVVVNGATVLKAGTAVTGKITASRSSSRPGRGSAPLSVALTSIKANGSTVAVKTASVQPQGATTAQTAEMRSRGVTAGNILVTPGTRMQFVIFASSHALRLSQVLLPRCGACKISDLDWRRRLTLGT